MNENEKKLSTLDGPGRLQMKPVSGLGANQPCLRLSSSSSSANFTFVSRNHCSGLGNRQLIAPNSHFSPMEAPVDDTDARVEVEDEGPGNFAQEGKMEIAPGISSQILMMIEAYGWVMLLSLMIFLYVRAKWSRKNPPRNDGLEYDSDQALARQTAMDAARQRMQDKLDVRAAQFAEEQKRKEEEKRKAKIEDWDRHREGKGYRSKYRPAETEAPSARAKPAEKKKPLRSNDYNPLTGEGGSSCTYRPGRPRGGGGG